MKGDRYVDKNAIAYLRMEYPNLVDPMGMLGMKEKTSEVSDRPPLENDLRARFVSIKELERVVVDSPRVGIYKMNTLEGALYYM